MSLVLTTASVPDGDKVAYWNAAVNRTLVPMTVTPRGDGPFDARMTTRRLACLQVSTMEADAADVRRTPALIARSSEALMSVSLQISGTATLVQDGRQAEVGEGDLVVCDRSRPYSFDYPERFATHIFQLPRSVLGLPDSDIRQVTGRAIGTEDGFGAFLRPFLSTLASSADACPPAVADRLAGYLVEMFATLIAETVPPDSAGAESARSDLRRRVRAYINKNLGDPDLSPESIARAHHFSVRYIHRLFEGEGTTVGRLVLKRRLEECHRELSRRGGTALTVSAVAQRWGFVSPSHFSRAFRAAYGVSPREWRSLRTARGDVGRLPADSPVPPFAPADRKLAGLSSSGG
ncbi:AraC-like ligand-binding domain-containing protein [Streptomyces sp. NPDC002308]